MRHQHEYIIFSFVSCSCTNGTGYVGWRRSSTPHLHHQIALRQFIHLILLLFQQYSLLLVMFRISYVAITLNLFTRFFFLSEHVFKHYVPFMQCKVQTSTSCTFFVVLVFSLAPKCILCAHFENEIFSIYNNKKHESGGRYAAHNWMHWI